MSDVPTNYRQLPGSELRPGPDSKFLGPAKDSETIKVTIVLRRRPDGPAMPDHSYYRDTPPTQRRRLSKEDFARKYGAHQSDIEKVSAFATSHGLSVVERAWRRGRCWFPARSGV